MATRIIPNTINEFPLFTYLFADLHPHLIAMPLTVLVLILAINLARAGHTTFARRMALGVLLALTLGALGPANTWDFPTYAALMLVLLTLSALRTGGWRSALRGCAAGCMVGVLALLLYLPYYRGYQAPPISPAWIAPLAASPAPAWLVVWGWQLLLSISFIVMEWRGQGLRLRLAGLYARSGWRRGLFRWFRLGGRGARCMLAAAWVCLVSLALIAIVALRFERCRRCWCPWSRQASCSCCCRRRMTTYCAAGCCWPRDGSSCAASKCSTCATIWQAVSGAV